MFKDLAKKSAKTFVAFVIWVFILSYQWQGRTLFARAHEVLVENSLVEFIDQQLSATWKRVGITAQETSTKLWEEAGRDEED
jgi:hypothetical protein